jgi:long-subunit fatty acid transport protein
MKLRDLVVVGMLVVPSFARAGGLFLPGSGAISTSRAGAAVATADDGEALGINPAGLAKSHGTTITVSAALIYYSMQFTRQGSYDGLSADDQPYEGTPYATATNDARPPLGIGPVQPIPVIAIVSDLGGRVKGLHVAAGLYAPNAYPFRDMSGGYQFNGDFSKPPPPTRYDILQQDAAVLFPSIAASYRISPTLDVGARFSYGIADLKSTLAIWGNPGNVEESVKDDALLTLHAKDNFVPAWGLGVTWRPMPQLELAANYNSAATVQATGTATSTNGPAVALNMEPIVIGPVAAGTARCAEGGTFDAQSGCVGLQLPMSATVGASYKFLGSNGEVKGDIELDVGWEHWGKRCEIDASGLFTDSNCTSPGMYRVIVDSAAYVDSNKDGTLDESEIALTLKDNFVEHKLKDTYSIRLGGSYHLPLNANQPAGNQIILRGGVGYDTRAAESGWLRADFDGTARVTTTVGGAYRTKKWEVNVGGGAIFEGTNTNPGDCNPTKTAIGCVGDGSEHVFTDRSGPDPINPIITPSNQFENPVTQGEYKSHYVLFMLGFSTWF